MIEDNLERLLLEVNTLTRLTNTFSLQNEISDLDPIRSFVDSVYKNPEEQWDYLTLKILDEMLFTSKSNYIFVSLFLAGFLYHIVAAKHEISDELTKMIIRVAFQYKEARSIIYMFLDTVAPQNDLFLKYKRSIFNQANFAESNPSET